MGIDETTFKKSMASFASGVTVITTRLDGEVRGMTASAFFSLSLRPPMVAVSVDHRARLHAALPKAGVFGVSILSRNQEDFSQHFAGMEPKDLSVAFDEVGGVPLIQGAIARMTCEVADTCEGGDHTIYLGRVTHIECTENSEPLIYFSGGYRSLT